LCPFCGAVLEGSTSDLGAPSQTVPDSPASHQPTQVVPPWTALPSEDLPTAIHAELCSATPDGQRPAIDGYEILGELGRGGVGVGAGREGRCLQGTPGAAETVRRPENAPARVPGRQGTPTSVPHRGGGGRPPPAPLYRPYLPGRRASGPAVLLHGVRRGRE